MGPQSSSTASHDVELFCVLFLFKFPTSGDSAQASSNSQTEQIKRVARKELLFSSLVFIVRKVIPCHVRVIIIILFYYFFFGHNIIKEKYFRESDCYCCAWYWSGVETWRALSTSHSINSSPHHWRSLIDGFVLLLIRSDVSKSNLVQTSHEGGRLDVASIAN